MTLRNLPQSQVTVTVDDDNPHRFTFDPSDMDEGTCYGNQECFFVVDDCECSATGDETECFNDGLSAFCAAFIASNNEWIVDECECYIPPA